MLTKVTTILSHHHIVILPRFFETLPSLTEMLHPLLVAAHLHSSGEPRARFSAVQSCTWFGDYSFRLLPLPTTLPDSALTAQYRLNLLVNIASCLLIFAIAVPSWFPRHSNHVDACLSCRRLSGPPLREKPDELFCQN